MARQAGSTSSEARLAIEAVKAIECCPEAKQALLAGELSLTQAHEVASSEAEVPGAEHELVEIARRGGLGALRDVTRERALRACDPSQLHERQRSLRELRHWRDGYGMVRIAGALAPDVGVPLMNRLEAEAERRRSAARSSGEAEPFAAYAADALVAAVSGDGEARPGRTELVLVCDLGAPTGGAMPTQTRCARP